MSDKKIPLDSASFPSTKKVSKVLEVGMNLLEPIVDRSRMTVVLIGFDRDGELVLRSTDNTTKEILTVVLRSLANTLETASPEELPPGFAPTKVEVSPSNGPSTAPCDCPTCTFRREKAH